MYAVIRHYHYTPQDEAEIEKMVREKFVPLIKKSKGFVRYYWINGGNGECASLSVFKDKAGAEESNQLAADYVRNHMSKRLVQKPEIMNGFIGRIGRKRT